MAVPGVAALRVARLVAVVMVLQAVLLAALAIAGTSGRSGPSLLVVSSRSDWAGLIANRINAVDGHPVRAYVGTTQDRAAADLADDGVQAYVVVDPSAPTDQLTVSSAQGDPMLLQQVVTQVSAGAGRTVRTTDLTPYAPGDGLGRAGYWFVLSLSIAGIAFAVGSSRIRAFEGRGAVGRWLAVAVGAALVTAAVGAGVTCWIVPSWSGHAAGLWLSGSAAMLTVALLVRAGSAIAGTAGATLVVVLLLLTGADPQTAGAWGFGRAGGFWAPIGPLAPVGAAVSAVRDLVQRDITPGPGRWIVLAWWCIAALVVVVLTRVNRGEPVSLPSGGDTGRHE